MDDSPQDVYAKYLPKHHGYPLWVPQLVGTYHLPREYQVDGIQIGDVGIIDPDSGFNVLLNVCKPADHPLHARWRHEEFPVFNCLRLNSKDIRVKSDAVLPGTVISSGVGRIDPPSHPGIGYEFAPSSTEGAILILPDGAVFHDFIPKDQFRDLAIQHALDWYLFATRCLQWPIDNHSLYLVTGFFKSRSWSLVSFKNAMPGDESHRIWATKAEEGNDTGNYNWGSTFHVEWNDGRRRAPNENSDQCIFLRGFKIALRDERFGLGTQRTTDLVAGELRVVVRWCSHMSLERISPINKPRLSQCFHPSDTINRYLLGKKFAMMVAVTHDTEWINFLGRERLSSYQLTQEDYLIQFLSEKCAFDPRHGIVYVEVEEYLTDESSDQGFDMDKQEEA